MISQVCFDRWEIPGILLFIQLQKRSKEGLHFFRAEGFEQSDKVFRIT
jgi:hypothetical protein